MAGAARGRPRAASGSRGDRRPAARFLPGIHRVSGRRTGPERGRAARWARAAALAAVLAPAACVGDLLDPSVPHPSYVFIPPLTDTVLDVGDTSLTLRCDLTADGHSIPCTLGISFSAAGGLLATRGDKLLVRGYGNAAITMQPLNTQLPVDTIERTGHVRAVVPRVMWADGRTGDTLGVGAMRLFLALAVTRAGASIANAPLRWVQDSGQSVAHIVPKLEGWIQTDAVGVAVFRVLSDTGATPPRRIVVVGGAAAPARPRPTPGVP